MNELQHLRKEFTKIPSACLAAVALTLSLVQRSWFSLCLGLCWAATFSPKAASAVDFHRDIHPIFSRYCLGCHGADSARGGLRLDRKPTGWQGGQSGRQLLQPGAPLESELFRRVSSHRADEVMPARGARWSQRRWTRSAVGLTPVPCGLIHEHTGPLAHPLPRHCPVSASRIGQGKDWITSCWPGWRRKNCNRRARLIATS